MHTKKIKIGLNRAFSIALLTVLFVTFLSPLVPAKKAQAAPNGALLSVTQSCNGAFDGGDPPNSLTNCESYENTLEKEAGCSKLIYSIDIHTDSTDNSVIIKKWYIKPGAFANCYKRVKAQLDRFTKSDGICRLGAKDSPNYDSCKDNQDNLRKVLGCEDLIYDSGDRYRYKPNATAACKAKLDNVGNIKLTLVRADGTTYTATTAVKDIGTSNDTENLGVPDNGTGSAKTQPDCDASLNSPLSWILCPVIDLGAALTDFIFQTFVRGLLEEVPISAETDDGGYLAWQQFRMLANIMLVGTLLAIVYGQVKGDR